jgi:hypothetical protein
MLEEVIHGTLHFPCYLSGLILSVGKRQKPDTLLDTCVAFPPGWLQPPVVAGLLTADIASSTATKNCTQRFDYV